MKMRSLAITPPRVRPESLGHFRFGNVDDWKVLTNDAGEWQALSAADFAALLKGEITDDHPQYRSLKR